MLLQPMLSRLMAARDLREILATALHDVMALHGAERGSLQLVAPDGQLVIVAQRNLSAEFLRGLARVGRDSGAVCERARATAQIAYVPDVEHDFACAALRELARSVPFRSVLCAPLCTVQRRCIGVVSVHSAAAFAPTTIERQALQRYAVRLADVLVATAGDALPAMAESLAQEVQADAAARPERALALK